MLDPDIQHVDGVAWWEAPLPPRLHHCKTQTTGWAGFHYIERCACGAHQMDHTGWYDKNERRKDGEGEELAPVTKRSQAVHPFAWKLVCLALLILSVTVVGTSTFSAPTRIAAAVLNVLCCGWAYKLAGRESS